MKESIPSMVQPPQAAQKLRHCLRVSRGVVLEEVVLEDDSGMRFTTTRFLDRLSIFNADFAIQRGLRDRLRPYRRVNIRAAWSGAYCLFSAEEQLPVVDTACISCIPLAACCPRTLIRLIPALTH